jgi:hypothetical protein
MHGIEVVEVKSGIASAGAAVGTGRGGNTAVVC